MHMHRASELGWRLRARSLWAALAVLAAVGCDQVGQPLVDHEGMTPLDLSTVPCTKPPPCEVGFVFDIDAGPPRPAAPVAGESCGGAAFAACPELQSEDDDADAGVAPDDAVVIEGAVLSDRNLYIERTQPLDVTLEGASLHRVFIHIEGPVTLRIKNSVLFEDVRVSGGHASSAARIELERVSGSGLRVAEPAQPFAGSLAIKRSSLPMAQLAVDDLSLESVELRSGSITANTLHAADTSFDALTMVTRLAAISASTLLNVQIPSCGAMALLASKLLSSQVSACRDEPLRVYAGSVIGGLIDGEIQSDDTHWEGVVLGLREPTRVTAWRGTFVSSNFCAQSQSAVLGRGTRAGCMRCDGGLVAPDAVCVVAPGDAIYENPKCDALTEPSLCLPPLPVRPRPFQ